jgi:RimJ/RimL family protein N-acetyltransferase
MLLQLSFTGRAASNTGQRRRKNAFDSITLRLASSARTARRLPEGRRRRVSSTRLIIDPSIMGPVGLAGFHGAPDAAGMVEVGYRVDPELRRRGYARQSLETLLAVARRHPDVRAVRAAISPDNAASLALVKSYGFVEKGEQWDEEDGREIIFETPA